MDSGLISKVGLVTPVKQLEVFSLFGAFVLYVCVICVVLLSCLRLTLTTQIMTSLTLIL